MNHIMDGLSISVSIHLSKQHIPTTLEVEEALSKLKAWESSPTSGSICNGLSGVEDLCKYVDKLLNLTSTQEVLSHNQKGKCHEELLDGSVRLLDVCSIARDILLRFREQVQALQSTFRRRKGDSSIESSVATFNCFRKKMKRDAKKLIASLKQMENKHGASSLLDQDHHLSAVIRVIREVNVTNCSIFQSLLVFLSTSSKPKQSRWSLVSKLMYKGVVAYKKLEALLTSIEDLESCLERVFRILIKTRASVLNLISL